MDTIDLPPLVVVVSAPTAFPRLLPLWGFASTPSAFPWWRPARLLLHHMLLGLTTTLAELFLYILLDGDGDPESSISDCGVEWVSTYVFAHVPLQPTWGRGFRRSLVW